MSDLGQQLREDRAKALRAAGVPSEEIPTILNVLAEMDETHRRDLMKAEEKFQQVREDMRREWINEGEEKMQRAIEDFHFKGRP